MGNLAEILGLRKLPEKPKSPEKVVTIIEPTRGEEKRKLEEECEEYLADPQKLSFADFSDFVERIISLVGGRKEERAHNTRDITSNPIIDTEKQASLTFRNYGSVGHLPDVSQIIFESGTQSERLQFSNFAESERLNHEEIKEISVEIVVDLHGQQRFNSYVKGETQEISNNLQFTEFVNATHAKNLANRVFDVYKKQQVSQSLTPQS